MLSEERTCLLDQFNLSHGCVKQHVAKHETRTRPLGILTACDFKLLRTLCCEVLKLKGKK